MAKVQFGEGIAYMSGRVAGNVFARNRGGNYIRRMAIPVNPSSTFQQAVRAGFSTASASWRDLSPSEQASWQAWAATHPIIDRLGAALLLTAQQAYVSIQRNVQSAGLVTPAYPNPPPTPFFEFPFGPEFEVDPDTGIPSITISTDVQPAADTTVFVYASPAVSPGKTNVKPLVKFLGPITALAADPPGTAYNITAAWEARFGSFLPFLLGQKISISVRTYSDGQLSGTTANAALVI